MTGDTDSTIVSSLRQIADTWRMRLIGPDGHGIEIRPTDYQFPDHLDERVRRSWLMIDGEARCAEGTWSFRWQALTPEDAATLPTWLRRAAAGELPIPPGGEAQAFGEHVLSFTEPNLIFKITEHSGTEIILSIGLDLEFSPPWRRQRRAGDPFVITSTLAAADLLKAADEWDTERAPFPP